MKTILRLPFAFLAAGLLLGACSEPRQSSTPAPASPAVLEPSESVSPPSPTPAPEAGGFTLEMLAALPPRDLLLQADYEPGFTRPEESYPFGRVPPFTLYASGEVIYLHEGASYAEQRLMYAVLRPEEALRLLEQVLDYGFDGLESYTEHCRAQPDGSQACVEDAATTILRARLPSGELRQVRIYADFANDPQAFQNVTAFLASYRRPSATAYQPSGATLFLLEPAEELEGRVYEWPLDPAVLRRPATSREWATYLVGHDLEKLLSILPRNMGDFIFEGDNQRVGVFLVPWLPEADYRQAILEAFPPPEEVAEPVGVFSDCPLPEGEASGGGLRLAYSQGGRIWLGEERQEPVELAEAGEVRQVRIANDGETVVFLRQRDGGPGEFWAVDSSGQNLRRIAGGGELTGSLQALEFSEDGQLLAFTHQVGETGAELWVAGVDGSGARKLVSVEELLAILGEFPEARGVRPASVQWLPGTHSLSFDALPDVEGAFIYVQDQAWLVDADTLEKRAWFEDGQGGFLSFSPDGRHLALYTPDRLSLAQAGGGPPREVKVPYFAIGFGGNYLYPGIAWAPDSSYFLLALPESEDYSQDGPVAIWEVPVNGNEPVKLAEFSGFAPSFQFSPDLSRLGYWKAPPESTTRELRLARVDGSEDFLYVTDFVIDFLSWSPDSQRFIYTIGEGEAVTTVLGDICADPRPLADFHAYPMWLEGNRFMALQETEGALQLFLATLPGSLEPILSPEDYDNYDFTLVPRP